MTAHTKGKCTSGPLSGITVGTGPNKNHEYDAMMEALRSHITAKGVDKWNEAVEKGMTIAKDEFMGEEPDGIAEKFAKIQKLDIGVDDKGKAVYEYKIVQIKPVEYKRMQNKWNAGAKTRSDAWEKYDEYGPKLFDLVLGQIEEELQDQMGHDDDFDKAKKDRDPLLLLQLLKKTCYEGAFNHDPVTTTILSMKSTCLTYQHIRHKKGGPMTTSNYKKMVQSNIDSTIATSGDFCFGTNVWKVEIKKDGKQLSDWFSFSEDVKQAYNKKVRDKLVARIMVLNTSRKEARDSLKNDYLKATKDNKSDVYPNTPSGAARYLDNYNKLHGPTDYKRNNNNDKDDNKNETRVASLHVALPQESDFDWDNDEGEDRIAG
jgi:hypothetical protein